MTACAAMDTVTTGPNRTQNRAVAVNTIDQDQPFANVADTDWSLPHHAAWIRPIVAEWGGMAGIVVPLQIGGAFISPGTRVAPGHDPSRPGSAPYQWAQADVAQISRALDCALTAGAAWHARGANQRKMILLGCAIALETARGGLIGTMVLDGAKTVGEADVEVSEAIDFANYYAHTFDDDPAAATFEPLGTILITPPWNFPLAIPAGGILAALMAGNAVVLKPAPEAVLTAWELCKVLWSAGVPMEVLQFVPTTDDEVGAGLVTDNRVHAVILTGAYATAQLFLSWKPALKLFAETSGKNSTIVTAMADRDQAVRDIVRSAFGHNGQKCSATSLAAELSMDRPPHECTDKIRR